MSSQEIIRKLTEAGFQLVHQKGSHQKFRHPDGRTVIVPVPRKDMPLGTLKNIEAQAKIKLTD